LYFRILFALIAALAPAAAQQGIADAFIAKIPGANLPSSVTLSVASVNGVPGQTVSIPIVLSFSAIAPGSFQVDLSFDATQLTFVSATGFSSTPLPSTGALRLSTPANNPSGLSAGVAGRISFALSQSFSAAGTTVGLANCISADPAGNPLSTGCLAGTIRLFNCAVTGDSSVSVPDVPAMINQALGIAPPADDMNQDGAINVIDIQKVLSAALGQACIY
jgi:hypothetical protein